MKMLTTSNLAGLGVLILSLGSAPGARPAQDAAPSSTPSQSAPSAQSHQSQLDCQNWQAAAEQMAAQARIIQKEMQGNLANLQDRLKWEGEMSSPQLAKLQALADKVAGQEGDLEARASELTARAQALASQIQQDQGQEQQKLSPLFSPNQDIVINSDDSGGWLGVEIDEVTAESAKDLKLSAVRGVVVKEVEPDSPAAKAGLKENDVITQYDGQVVEGTVQFRRLVRETPPGRTITLAVSRDGASQSFSVELGDRGALMQKRMQGMMRDFGGSHTFVTPNFDFNGPESFSLMDNRTPMLGISAMDLNAQLGNYFGAPGGEGVLVLEVRSGTPAEKAGLKAGDVIVTVEAKPVHTLAELREQLRDKSDQKPVSLGILRKENSMNVPVTIEKPRPYESIQMMHRAQL
jgi:serine protease Do